MDANWKAALWQQFGPPSREKCRAAIEALTDEKARERRRFAWIDTDVLGLLLYNMRHVQHHAAQLNLILRQTLDSAPAWVAQARS